MMESGKLLKKEWKKDEKQIYQPKTTPMRIDVPRMNFFMLRGQGNPNSPAFAECIEALYAASYAVRMSYKGDFVPEGFYEYTVYPLEGVWDLTETGRKMQLESQVHGVEGLKDELLFELMIRQPDFLTEEWAKRLLAVAIKKKKLPLLEQVTFVTIEEGTCLQMLHEGPYDDEPASFAKMEAYCEAQGITRLEKTHREIYLSDARKVAPEKLKTILRFKVK